MHHKYFQTTRRVRLGKIISFSSFRIFLFPKGKKKDIVPEFVFDARYTGSLYRIAFHSIRVGRSFVPIPCFFFFFSSL